jgi:hypothetical protein
VVHRKKGFLKDFEMTFQCPPAIDERGSAYGFTNSPDRNVLAEKFVVYVLKMMHDL